MPLLSNICLDNLCRFFSELRALPGEGQDTEKAANMTSELKEAVRDQGFKHTGLAADILYKINNAKLFSAQEKVEEPVHCTEFAREYSASHGEVSRNKALRHEMLRQVYGDLSKVLPKV
ncbi:hypothetical protein LTR85_011089 [Meristemomyces frigidus]|nr:hypothetical protein LTR85_011089 [Meristemomyces frigidus]